MKIYMLIIMFLLIGALFLISENNLALKKSENRAKLGTMYLAWAGKLFDNSKQLTGYIVKLDWLPKNQTSG